MLIGFELASRPAKRNCKLGVCRRPAKLLICLPKAKWVPNGPSERPRESRALESDFELPAPVQGAQPSTKNGRIPGLFRADHQTERLSDGRLGGARGIRTLGTTDTGTCYTWIPRQLRAHLLPLNAASASSRSSENNTSKMPSDRLSCETVSWWCFKCLETPCDGRYRGTAPPGTAQGDRRGSPAGRCAPRTRARRR